MFRLNVKSLKSITKHINLNTSYVSVKLTLQILLLLAPLNLNTSYVSVKSYLLYESAKIL